MNKIIDCVKLNWKPIAAGVAAVVLIALLWAVGGRESNPSPSLMLVQKEGEALFSANGAIWEFADIGISLPTNSVLKTSSRAKAMLLTPMGRFIRLGENTELKATLIDKSTVLLTQNSGRTFHRIKSTDESQYQVSALGNILKINGAAFDLSVNPTEKRINIKVFEGEVILTLATDTSGPIALGKGNEITVDANANSAPSPVAISADYANGEWFLWNKTEDLKLGYELRLDTSAEAVASATEKNTTGDVSKPTTPTSSKTTTTPSKTTAAPAPSTGDCRPSLSLKQGLGGIGIQLNWTTCKNDDFQFYKVVRSTTNPSPSYPSTPALASSNNRFFGSYLDKNLAIGTTYYYRVCVVERLNKVGCGNVAKMSN